MTDTTTAASGSAIKTAPLEQGIAAALESMRRAAEEAAAKGRDDFYDVWTAEALDRQPMIFVAAALPGATMAWLIDPSANEGVLEVDITHRFDLTGEYGEPRSDLPPAVRREMWTRLYDAVAEDVSWLVRERYGTGIREHQSWSPETD
jgi:hypothetical protein